MSEQWIKEQGGADIAIGGNGSYIIGNASASAAPHNSNIVYKFNPNGSQAWAKTIHENNYSITDIAYAPEGSIYLCGYLSPGDGRNWDSFITKVSSNGDLIWTDTLDKSGFDNLDRAQSITVSSSNSIYVTGYTNNDLDGNLNQGYTDIFISQFDLDGNKQWTKLIGTSFEDVPYEIITDLNGNVFISGYTNGNLNGEINRGGLEVILTLVI